MKITEEDIRKDIIKDYGITSESFFREWLRNKYNIQLIIYPSLEYADDNKKILHEDRNFKWEYEWEVQYFEYWKVRALNESIFFEKYKGGYSNYEEAFEDGLKVAIDYLNELIENKNG